MKGQEMIKVPESPYPGFCNMNRGGIVIGCGNDQAPVLSPLNQPDSLCFQKVLGFFESCG